MRRSGILPHGHRRKVVQQLLKTESGFATGDIALSWFENVTSEYWQVGCAS